MVRGSGWMGPFGFALRVLRKAFAATVLSVFACASAHAATYLVNNSGNGDGAAANCPAGSTATTGPCTLRDALAAVQDGDTVNFAFTSPTTIVLQSYLTIANAISVQGPVSGSGLAAVNLVTLSGNNQVRVLYVSPQTITSPVTLRNLNVTQGKVQIGAGIYGDRGRLILINSAVSGNTADFGAAIYYAANVLTLINSTVSGNTATSLGGGILVGNAALIAVNSTFTGNGAGDTGGGIQNGAGSVALINSTVSGNHSASYGGGVNSINGVHAVNSIIAGNTQSGSGDINPGLDASSGGNVVSYIDNVVDPKLASLGNYGGPTQTMIALPGSPAICTGDPARALDAGGNALPTDQRGAPRSETAYSITPCVDAGAVQTHYSLAYVQQPSDVPLNATMSPAPALAVSENGIAFNTTALPALATLTSLGTIEVSDAQSALSASATTSAAIDPGTGRATFPALSFSSVHASDTLSADLVLRSTNPIVTLNQASDTFAILQLPALVTITDLQQTYSGLPLGVGVTTSPPGLAVAVTYDGSPTQPTSAGSYAVVATVTDAIYTGSSSATLVIDKAPLTITADDQSRRYGAANPPFTYTPSGFVNGETATVLSGAPAMASTDTPTSPVGTSYPITIAQGSLSAQNYRFSFVGGNLQVTGTAATTTGLVASSASTVYGQSVTLTAAVALPEGGILGGTVAFTDGAAALPGCGAVPLAGGSAQCQMASLAVGAHAITAAYSGDANTAGSSSPGVNVVVAKASTSTTLTPPAPVSLGQSVSIAASMAVIAPGAGAPSGTITVSDGDMGAGDRCTIAITAAASGGSCSLTPASAGSKPLSAVFVLDAASSGHYEGSSAAVGTSLTINPAQAGMVLSSSANPSAYGQTVTITATVTPPAGVTQTPSGSVAFSAAGASICPAQSLVAGVGNASATCVVNAFVVGNRTVSAHYGGDANNRPADASLAGGQTVNAANTTTTIAPPTAIRLGETLTVNVSVATQSPGSGTPTGTVTIADGSASCQATLDAAGSGSCTLTPPAPAGNHQLSASYAATTNFAASAGTTTVTVNAAPAGTIVTSSVNPSRFSHSVTFTATVTPAAGNPMSTGHVDFSDGGTALAGCTSLPLSGGAATCAASTLAVGSHTIQASYSGDANNLPSSGTLTQTVGKDTTTMSLDASPNPAGAIQGIALTATVYGDPPTGTVTFYDGTRMLGTAMLTTVDALSSSAELTVGPLGSGTHSLSTTYAGDGNNEGSASAVLVVTVNAPVVPAPVLSPWLLALLGLGFGGLSVRRLRA